MFLTSIPHAEELVKEKALETNSLPILGSVIVLCRCEVVAVAFLGMISFRMQGCIGFIAMSAQSKIDTSHTPTSYVYKDPGLLCCSCIGTFDGTRRAGIG